MRKRYYAFSRYLKEKYGRPVYKIPIDAGLTCPNRDGTVGFGGCTFCANRTFSVYADTRTPIPQQIAETKTRVRQRHPDAAFMAYFQAYTNTYADLETLKRLYEPTLADPDIVALAIGTRPDCVPDPVLDLIAGYRQRLEVWMEYGLQSIHDSTLQMLNRGHTAQDFIDAAARTKERGMQVCAHVILGLPLETLAHALAAARALNDSRVDAVKIHHLQVIRGTRLAAQYAAGSFSVLSLNEYVQWVCAFLEHLHPATIIQRLVGDSLDGASLLAPRWNHSKSEVLQAIDRELARRHTRQGRLLASPS